jgi:hypothetical protein
MISEKNKATIAEMLSAAMVSDNMFDWQLSDEQVKDQLKTYGFIYRCLVDNTSNPMQWLEFSAAVGRNAVAAIIGCHESHLLTGVVTVMYPELGLSPAGQAGFVWMVARHPQANEITELRVVTRAPFLVSDAKSYNVRIIQYDGQVTKDLGKGMRSTYYAPAVKAEDKHRLLRNRRDPYFTKGETLGMFMNFAKDEEDLYGIYMGEDEYFVYWRRAGDVEIFHTEHRVIWYDLNVVLIDKKESSDIADMFVLEKAEKVGDKVTFRKMNETKSMIREYLKTKI